MNAETFGVPAGGVAAGVVRVPGSKSIAQRALVCALLARGVSELRGVPTSTDLVTLRTAVSELGARLEELSDGRVLVHGVGAPLPRGDRRLHLGPNGTALRLLLAVCALRDARTFVSGASHRPVAPLTGALRELGADVDAVADGSLRVVGRARLRGRKLKIDGSTSSQFASALLTLGAWVEDRLELQVTGMPVSTSYLELTIAMLGAFGVRVARSGDHVYEVPGDQEFQPTTVAIEPDLSAAAFYLSAAAVTGGEVTVTGFGETRGPVRSLQGDARIVALLEALGCDCSARDGRLVASGAATKPIVTSLRNEPDLLPPLAAVAALVPGRSHFDGVGHLRHKESDRLEVLAAGLRAVGVEVVVGADSFEVVGAAPERLRGAALDPQGDHRMAMAFGLLGLRIPGVIVRDPSVVAKSDPEFWGRLGSLFTPATGWPPWEAPA